MTTKTRWIFLVSLGLIGSFIIAQAGVTSVASPQPAVPGQALNDQHLIQLLTMLLQSKTNANDRDLINSLIRLLESRQTSSPQNVSLQLQTTVPGRVEVRSEPTPASPIVPKLSEPAPSLSPTKVPVFDEDRSDDSLVQVNNLRITKVNINPSSDVKAYLYVVKDTGWKCVLYKSVDSAVVSQCPLDIRRPIIQQEFVVRVNNDTILLLRNRQRADIAQFKIGDKINVYGFIDKDNFTIDALVVRKIASLSQVPIPGPKPVAPLPVQPLPPSTSTLPIYKLPLRWFTGYLEKIMISVPAVESKPAISSNQNQATHYLTTDDNLVYSVMSVDETSRSLLEKYSNQRVRLYAFVNSEAKANILGSLLAKNVVPLVSSATTTSITTSTKRLMIKSVSGTLENAGISIYMWGTHILKADDGITYQVKALDKNVQESLNKYNGKRVTIYAKKIEYKNLEGGFWAIEAEKVILLE